MDNLIVRPVIQGLASLTLVADILIVLILILFISIYFEFKSTMIKKAKILLTDNSITISLVVATVATLGSLFFSEVAKYTPCNLCWYQRIFMYPLPILLGISLITEDKNIKKYVLPLATIGFLIASYHYNLQMFPNFLPCSDALVSCARKGTEYFGFITIPMMSASAFLLIILANLPSFMPKKNK